jgi:HD-GYP domain-containing protein (c-di-GMP phosphodiesterase class II)
MQTHPLVDELSTTFADHPVGATGSANAVRRELARIVGALDADHAHRVRQLSIAIGRSMRLHPAAMRALSLGSALHDVGKLSIPREILEKPGPLSKADWSVVRRHPADGEAIVARLIEAPEVLAIIRSHHERWDGGGYPDGLVREQIPIGARIVAVSDAFHAMTETRPYRPARSQASALDELVAHVRTQFDPACVGAVRALVADGGRRRAAASGRGDRSSFGSATVTKAVGEPVFGARTIA